jgi:hypothetical protein
MSTVPIIYDIANDHHAAHFGIQPAERERILAKRFTNRAYAGVQGRPEHIGLHIQDGTTWGSLDWWANGRDRDGNPINASSTVLVQKDGSVLRCIPEQHGPWTNGDVKAPTAESATLRARGGNPNLWCLTLEAEGRPWDAMPEVQLAAIVWVCRDWMTRYPWIGLDDLFPHRSINSVDRANCGLYLPAVKSRLAGTRPTPAPTPGAQGTFGSIVRFSKPTRVTVMAPAGVNVRQWGELDAAIMRAYPAGHSFFADGYVYGEAVAGEDRWYIETGRGYRIWSGATDKPLLPRR